MSNCFAPSEWDADVPGENAHDNLTKKNKLRNKRKHDIDTESTSESISVKKNQNEVKNYKSLTQKINKDKQGKKKSVDDNFTLKSLEAKLSKNAKKKLKKTANKEKNKQIIKNTIKDVNLIHHKLNGESSVSPNKRQELISSDLSLVENLNGTKNKKNLKTMNKNALKKQKNKALTTNKPVSKSVTKTNTIVKFTDESEKQNTSNSSPVKITSGLSQTEKNRRRRKKKKNLESSPKETTANPPIIQIKEGKIKKPKERPNKIILKKKHSFVEKMRHILTNNTSDITSSEMVQPEKEEQIVDVVKKPKTLREKMMERLKGARFRYLNEQMYVKESNDAQQLFKEDPSAFQAYHDGYRQQVRKWPLNPLDVIINDISNLPKEYIIADLGCGDGRLSRSVPQKVHSFDLVSLNPSVQACDMSHTPLLASQVNIVVFCLSLMGTNLKDYIAEANRILKIGGMLKVAEVESRFTDVEAFLKDIQKYGFSLIKSDLNQNLFYFMDFKKEKDITKRNKLPGLSLKPCYYKKR